MSASSFLPQSRHRAREVLALLPNLKRSKRTQPKTKSASRVQNCTPVDGQISGRCLLLSVRPNVVLKLENTSSASHYKYYFVTSDPVLCTSFVDKKCA